MDDEAPPRPNLKTAPTALKKLGRVNTPTFSTESAHFDVCRAQQFGSNRSNSGHAGRTLEMTLMTYLGCSEHDRALLSDDISCQLTLQGPV